VFWLLFGENRIIADLFCWNYTTTWRTDGRTDSHLLTRSAELTRRAVKTNVNEVLSNQSIKIHLYSATCHKRSESEAEPSPSPSWRRRHFSLADGLHSFFIKLGGSATSICQQCPFVSIFVNYVSAETGLLISVRMFAMQPYIYSMLLQTEWPLYRVTAIRYERWTCAKKLTGGLLILSQVSKNKQKLKQNSQ